jgi:hypothetical protein
MTHQCPERLHADRCSRVVSGHLSQPWRILVGAGVVISGRKGGKEGNCIDWYHTSQIMSPSTGYASSDLNRNTAEHVFKLLSSWSCCCTEVDTIVIDVSKQGLMLYY